jgi:hypothetical protein
MSEPIEILRGVVHPWYDGGHSPHRLSLLQTIKHPHGGREWY